MGTYNGSDKRLAYLFANGGGGGGSANIWTGTHAEYEAQASQIPNGTLVNFTDDEEQIDGEGEIYSLVERCIGLWTDNKPLYQKTFITEKTNIVANSTIDVTSEVESVDAETVVSYKHKMTYDVSQATARGEYWDDSIARFGYNDVNSTYSIILTLGSSTLATLKIVWTIEYTKTSDSPLVGVSAGNNTVYIASSDCYSMDEKEIGCWVNGKPLYQRTVLISAVTTGTTYPHGISDVEDIWVFDVKAKRNTAWFTSGHIFEDAPNNITESFSVIAGATDIYAYVYGNTVTDCYVTVRYTKTTDVAGSGKFVPAGIPAVHYSVEEQVIGTWHTGETLYEKTIVLPNRLTIPQSHAWVSTGINMSYVKELVHSFVNSNRWDSNNINVFIDSNILQLVNLGASGVYVSKIVVQYTKN